MFRTDANLRPEGRTGRSRRTIDSYASYYDDYAQTWEFQALIKARPVAGDTRPRRPLHRAHAPVRVARASSIPERVREIRAMKERVGGAHRAARVSPTASSSGAAAASATSSSRCSCSQLVHGRHDEALRSPNTLDALARSCRMPATWTAADARAARRRVPLPPHRRASPAALRRAADAHHPVRRARPHAARARARISRRRGAAARSKPSRPTIGPHQATVRSIHERLFFAPLLDTLAGGAGALSPEAAAEDRLAAFGFTDVERTRAAVRELAVGLTRRSKLMQQLLPVILDGSPRPPIPTSGCSSCAGSPKARPVRRSLATTFRDAPGAAERTCTLLGSSRLVGDALRRHPEFVDVLGGRRPMLGRRSTRAELVDGGHGDARVAQRRRSADATGLRRFKRRELLRIAARDLLGFAPLEVDRARAHRARRGLPRVALVGLEPPLPFTVIGMGRLGGAELSYASDIDVLFVYDGDSRRRLRRRRADRRAARRRDRRDHLAKARRSASTPASVPRGTRAHSRDRSPGSPPTTNAAGSRGSARRCRRRGSSPATRSSARRFAALVDRRRLRAAVHRGRRARGPPHEGAHRARAHPSRARTRSSTSSSAAARCPTSSSACSSSSCSTAATCPICGCPARSTHCTRLLDARPARRRRRRRARSRVPLLRTGAQRAVPPDGRPSDALPTDRAEIEKLGLLLGYVHQPATSLRDDYRRLTRRARRVVEREFYGTR